MATSESRLGLGATDEGLAAHLDFPFSSARGLSRGRRADCTALAACPKSERFLVSSDLDFLNPLQPKPCFWGRSQGFEMRLQGKQGYRA